MTSAGVGGADYPVDTRQRLLDVAMTLISQHGFAGTSLQMIADELGFTKAAIYYHFRARDQLLIALMEPLLQQIRHVVETAESQTRHALRWTPWCGASPASSPRIGRSPQSWSSIRAFTAYCSHSRTGAT